jgi:hypothetical protein
MRRISVSYRLGLFFLIGLATMLWFLQLDRGVELVLIGTIATVVSYQAKLERYVQHPRRGVRVIRQNYLNFNLSAR